MLRICNGSDVDIQNQQVKKKIILEFVFKLIIPNPLLLRKDVGLEHSGEVLDSMIARL